MVCSIRSLGVDPAVLMRTESIIGLQSISKEGFGIRYTLPGVLDIHIHESTSYTSTGVLVTHPQEY